MLLVLYLQGVIMLAELNKWIKSLPESEIIDKGIIMDLFTKFSIDKQCYISKTAGSLNFQFRGIDINDVSKDQIAQEMNNYNTGDQITIKDSDFTCLYAFRDKGGNINDIILTEQKEIKIDLIEIETIINNIIRLYNQNALLSNTLKLMYSEFPQDKDLLSLKLPDNYILAAVPAVAYSVVHEMTGPIMIRSIPSEFNSMENLLFVVNIFSTINSEMIKSIGQVFTSQTLSEPEYSEATNVLFTLHNPNARGEVELHAISIVISQDFINISNSVLINIKGILFSAVEKVRQTTNELDWNLFETDPEDIPQVVISKIDEIISSIQKQIAGLFSTNIPAEDLENW